MGTVKALLLLSGGIDSPVAAHLMQQRGLELIALHFYNKNLGDINTVEKCRELCKKLGIPTLYLIPYDEELAELVRTCRHKYYYLLMRRLMFRVAEKLAKENECSYVVTGENLGQVGSQTLSNLCTTTQAIKMPILRPLLCFDKIETIRIAEQIGTYKISKGPEVCCLLGPKHPATRSDVKLIEAEEARLDYKEMIEACLRKMEKAEIMQQIQQL